MSQITSIELTITSGNREDAGTDGFVYLGLAGREFHVGSSGDDFEQGRVRTYRFGANANIADPDHNDPREPWPTRFSRYQPVPKMHPV